MYFPFIPKDEALILLEDANRADESRSEFIAEHGSGAVSLGYSSADALRSAQTELAFLEAEFAQSEEGERYFARLQAARLYDALPSPLTSWDIPEFVDGKPSYAHSPFARHIVTTDDIPF